MTILYRVQPRQNRRHGVMESLVHLKDAASLAQARENGMELGGEGSGFSGQ